MTRCVDYQRGLEAARVDAKRGWPCCWMPARHLAEEAVYSAAGLSPEQLGYAAGLDEAFPGGIDEIGGFLEGIQPQGPSLVVDEAREESKSVVAPTDALLPVAVGKPGGKVFHLRGMVFAWVNNGRKKPFLARFV